MENSGYSKTPLARKLGLKPGFTVYLYAQPTYYFELFEDLPDDLILTDKLKRASVDFIHIFSTTQKDLASQFKKCLLALKKDGLLWISWPKGSSKMETDLKRDLIRHFILDEGLVDVKVCSVDEIWSGLKFVYRLKDRS